MFDKPTVIEAGVFENINLSDNTIILLKDPFIFFG